MILQARSWGRMCDEVRGVAHRLPMAPDTTQTISVLRTVPWGSHESTTLIAHRTDGTCRGLEGFGRESQAKTSATILVARLMSIFTEGRLTLGHQDQHGQRGQNLAAHKIPRASEMFANAGLFESWKQLQVSGLRD